MGGVFRYCDSALIIGANNYIDSFALRLKFGEKVFEKDSLFSGLNLFKKLCFAKE